MASKDQKKEYESLTSRTDIPPEGEFSLEEILAEYGGGREKLLRDVEQAAAAMEEERTAPPREETVPDEGTAAEEALPAEEKTPEPPRRRKTVLFPGMHSRPEHTPPEEREEPEPSREEPVVPPEDLPEAPHPVSIEEVVNHTVDAVMEERREPLIRPRLGLFSRKKLEETEKIYPPPEPEPEVVAEPIGPEPDPRDAAADAKDDWRSRRASLPAALVAALVPCVLMGAEAYGYSAPLWSTDQTLQSVFLLACLAVVALMTRHVFAYGVRMLLHKRCTGELLCALSALVAAADCVSRLMIPERSSAMPYAAVSCLGLVFAQWGLTRRSRGEYDTFRTAALDPEPPYLVTETDHGACKQRGDLPGFYTTASQDPLPLTWQAALLPVVLMATVVFAGLSSLGQGRGADFFLNWSAILCAAASFALPLCWGLPFSRLAQRLQKTGCAVAGWRGADRISRKKTMIVTDSDLFPPGTVALNGVKVFGEELPKAASYAATMCRAAGSGLEWLFDGLMRSEGGRYERADDFSFYQEGGYSATIHGESVLLGTASFMRKMEVRLPGGINLRTGIFLAIDRQLAAVFAVKYNASENVDYALRMMRRSHITPILAARDPNITPALLKRKFHKGVKVEYPDLTVRVALSEAELDRGLPRALLFREGLLPYAETVVGSRRMCRTVRRAAALAILGSVAGTLLSFYLVFSGAYDLVSPLYLAAFLLLWTLPVLVMSDWCGRY